MGVVDFSKLWIGEVFGTESEIYSCHEQNLQNMKKFHGPFLKVRQSRKQIMVYSILPKNEQKITILSIFQRGDAQDSDFLFVFWEN